MLIVLGVIVGLIVLLFVWAAVQPTSNPTWGVTFSPDYARYLGLDAGQAYHAVLDDLNARAIRLPLYWDEIEKTPGKYDWSDIDWYVWDAAQHHVAITLVLGERTSRWPECRIPAWASTDDVRNKALVAYVGAAVDHFKGN